MSRSAPAASGRDVAVALALLSAVAYGVSDFGAGLASRRYATGPVSGAAMALGLGCAAMGTILFGGDGPHAAALEWGALSGLGGGVGTLALYHGLAVGRMTVVATLSAVLTAVVPVIVGFLLGNQLSTGTVVGIVIAIPAVALVSWQPGSRQRGREPPGGGQEPAGGDREPAGGDREPGGGGGSGVASGIFAGLGFSLLFIALDRAGTRSGAWPLVPGQAVGLALIAPFAVRGYARAGRPRGSDAALTLGAGVLSGVANLLFLAATGHGQLAVVAVLTAFTVLMARVFLAERWTRTQAGGLVVAAAAIVLVSAG